MNAICVRPKSTMSKQFVKQMSQNMENKEKETQTTKKECKFKDFVKFAQEDLIMEERAELQRLANSCNRVMKVMINISEYVVRELINYGANKVEYTNEDIEKMKIIDVDDELLMFKITKLRLFDMMIYIPKEINIIIISKNDVITGYPLTTNKVRKLSSNTLIDKIKQQLCQMVLLLADGFATLFKTVNFLTNNRLIETEIMDYRVSKNRYFNQREIIKQTKKINILKTICHINSNNDVKVSQILMQPIQLTMENLILKIEGMTTTSSVIFRNINEEEYFFFRSTSSGNSIMMLKIGNMIITENSLIYKVNKVYTKGLNALRSVYDKLNED